jgi:hypothetical protein
MALFTNGVNMTSPQETVEDKRGKTTTIIVNTRPKEWPAKEISFDQVVSLAYDGNPPSGPDWVFTVTYRKGVDSKKEGTMVEGDTLRIKDEMVFNVTATNKS